MQAQANDEKPLNQRVSEILQFKDADYIVEEIENTAETEILEELRNAEEELQQVQQRIARLRGLLVVTEPAKYT